MARFQPNRDQFSLFAFLDVLAGVVGILALIIVTMAAFGLENTKKIIRLPSNHRDAIPVYVECSAKTVIVHPEKETIAVSEIDKEGSLWSKTLKDIKDSSGSRYVVFLIRSDGTETFEKLYRKAERAAVKIGYDVVDGDEEIIVQ